MQEQVETEPYVLSIDEFEDIIIEDTRNNVTEAAYKEAILQDVGENGKVHPSHRKCNQVCQLIIFKSNFSSKN